MTKKQKPTKCKKKHSERKQVSGILKDPEFPAYKLGKFNRLRKWLGDIIYDDGR